MTDETFEDDPWRDAGIEAEDDVPTLRPRRPWFEYAGFDQAALAPRRACGEDGTPDGRSAEGAFLPLACPSKDC